MLIVFSNTFKMVYREVYLALAVNCLPINLQLALLLYLKSLYTAVCVISPVKKVHIFVTSGYICLDKT